MSAAPQSADIPLEAMVLGAVLLHPGLFPQAAHLDADAFFDAAHATVWTALRGAVESGHAISVSGLALASPEALDPHGGMKLLAALADRGQAILTSFPQAVDRLHELCLWRRVATLSSRLTAACQTRKTRPEDVLAGLSQYAQKVLAGGRDTAMSKREVARRAVERARQNRPIVCTGLDSLDFLMQGGLQSSRLYGIGGPTGRGKTILLGSISENLNIQNETHLFISLETDPLDIEIRSCARHLGLNAAQIFDRGDQDHGKFVSAADGYAGQIPDNVRYEFTPGATMDDIHRMILRARSRHGIRGFMIDYWQLIRGRERGQNEAEHLRHCADRLAAICRQEDIWGVITAQVDDHGRLKISDSLMMATSLYVRLVRDENETASFFRTEKSNYTRYADTGSESVPGMVFDAAGPHFRNTRPEDVATLRDEEENDLGVR